MLLGPMGAGKTTIGSALSEALGMAFADSDDAIEERTGGSGADYAATRGVPALHALERTVCLEALLEPEPAVVSAAASVVDDASVREELESQTCVWLDADPEVRTVRRDQGEHRRPVTGDASRSLEERRRPHLAELSILRVDTTETSVEECVSVIVASLD